jgi:hypothetical protein
MFLQHQHHPVGSGIPYNIGVGGRPCSDPANQPPTAIGTLLPAADDCFYDSAHLHHHQPHPLSTATSSSTLVVNNGNNGGQANLQPTPGSTPKTERKGKRISSIFVGSLNYYILIILDFLINTVFLFIAQRSAPSFDAR